MNSWSISDSYYTPIDEGFYQETLDAGVYTLIYTDHGPILKKESDKFNLPKKIYRLNDIFIDRVIKTYHHQASNTLGVLLYGLKGTSKSLTAQLLCNKLELPVIVVKTSERISSFINSIQQDVIVLIDEFEKIYDRKNEHSSDLLSLLDGLNTVKYKRLFILTCNELFVNDNLLDRPGRIRYKKEYTNLPKDVVNEIIYDKLTWFGGVDHVKESVIADLVKTVSSLNIVTIDIVIALIEEVNLHQELASILLTDFNLKINTSTFNIIRQLILNNSDGTTYLAPIEVVAHSTSIINHKSFTGTNNDCGFYIDNVYQGEIKEKISETKGIVENEIEYQKLLKDPYLKKYLKELNLKDKFKDDDDTDITILHVYTITPLTSRNIYSYL